MTDSLEDEPCLLLESLSPHLVELRPLGREVSLRKGDALWKEGEPGDEVVLLLAGSLVVVRRAPQGEPLTIRRLYPGALAAESGALEGLLRGTTVLAEADARALLMPAAGLREFLATHPDLLQQLFWLQVRRVHAPPARCARRGRITDPLTGLYDGAFFVERLALEIERAQLSGDTVVVALFEVDHFRSYNDAHGSEAGDSAVRTLAQLLRKTGRRGDVAARLGGEEFVTLLYGATASDGWRFAEAFRGAVMAANFPRVPGQKAPRITVSGGISSYPVDAQDEIALIDAARARLERAKQAGCNCTVGAAVGAH